MGVFSDLFSGSKAKEPYYQAAAGRQAGLTQATGTLEGGYADASKWLEQGPQYLDTAKGYLESAKAPLATAISRFDPLTGTANAGFNAYGNLYGIGGGDPAAAVRSMPGYQFSQSEGAEQAMRAALGNVGVGSGNALQSVFDRGANIADTKWQQYAEGLKPFLQLAPGMAQIQGGYNVAQSGLEAQKGGLEAQKGQYATGQAGLETGLANLLSQYQTGTANANSQSIIDAQNASNAASKNVFDAVMGGVKLAASAATGMPMGGGGSGGNMFGNLFGGGGNPSSAAYGSNPFTPYGTVNPAYG